jgi:hypothetical protein
MVSQNRFGSSNTQAKIRSSQLIWVAEALPVKGWFLFLITTPRYLSTHASAGGATGFDDQRRTTRGVAIVTGLLVGVNPPIDAQQNQLAVVIVFI